MTINQMKILSLPSQQPSCATMRQSPKLYNNNKHAPIDLAVGKLDDLRAFAYYYPPGGCEGIEKRPSKAKKKAASESK
jgi:hypothetical protein